MRAAAPSPTRAPQRAHDVAPGTCGEIAQGVLPDGTRFAVSCPIELGTTVEVSIDEAAEFEIAGVPAGRAHLERALRRTAERLELGPCRIAVSHRTELPIGKGMASSTADIVAASRALSRAAGFAPVPEDVAELAASIEPSDGVMYDGIVASDRRTGRLVRAWDWWPSFVVVMVVPPETFVTAAARFDGQGALANEYAELLERLDAAVDRRDTVAFAEVATRSARLGQRFVANDAFAHLAARAATLGALGVCTAHTGTVAGMLFPRTRAGEAASLLASVALRASMPSDHEVTITRTPSCPISQG